MLDKWSALISAFAELLWPLLLVLVIYLFRKPVVELLQAITAGKISFKVGTVGVSAIQYSELTEKAISDLQIKVAAFESTIDKCAVLENRENLSTKYLGKSVLWVDDNPTNNAYYVTTLISEGIKVDLATSTKEAMEKLSNTAYSLVITDILRPEGNKAGIELIKEIKKVGMNLPIFVFCGGWAASNLKAEVLQAGANAITSSGTTLLANVTNALEQYDKSSEINAKQRR